MSDARDQAIVALQADCRRLQRELAQVEAALRALGEKPITGQKPRKVGESSIRGRTIKILDALGCEMHVDRIVEALNKDGGPRHTKATVASTLAHDARRTHTFYRARKTNTFGLVRSAD